MLITPFIPDGMSIAHPRLSLARPHLFLGPSQKDWVASYHQDRPVLQVIELRGHKPGQHSPFNLSSDPGL